MRSASKKSKSSGRRAAQRRGYGRPFVAATFAMTVDGKITTKNFSPVDFTSREDKTHLFRQRALGDAVLIGHSTLRHDNVRLGLSDPKLREERVARGQRPCPLRVIISNEGRIDPSLKIFQTEPAKAGPIVIFSTLRMPARYQKALRKKGTLHLSDAREVDLAWMLRQLRHDYGVRTVACEGGATLFRALLEQDLVDQPNLTASPVLGGGARAPTSPGRSKVFPPRSVLCSLTIRRVVGEDCFLTYRIKQRQKH